MDYESVVHLFIGHESHDRSTNNVILEKLSITPGQSGGGAKTAPLEIAITLDPTVLPDKKGMGVKAAPYKKVVQRHKVHIDPKLLKEFNELLGIKKRP